MPRPNPIQRCRAVGPARWVSASSLWTPNAVIGLTFRWDWTTGKFTDAVGGAPPPVTSVSADGDRIGWWADSLVSQYLLGFANVTACVHRPTGGPSSGKAGVEWNGSTDTGSFVASGSTVIPADSSRSMLCIVKNAGATGRSAVCGRGGFNGEGFTLHFDASNQMIGIVRGAAIRTLTGPVVGVGSWCTALLSYDGTTPRLIVRVGGATTTVAGAATSGPLVFHASDTGFAAGATGQAGASAFNNNGGKTIAQILVASSNYDAGTGTAYVNSANAAAGLS